VDPHCFDADPEPDPDPAQKIGADPDQDPDPDPRGGERVGQPKMCIPPGKILTGTCSFRALGLLTRGSGDGWRRVRGLPGDSSGMMFSME